MRVHEIFFLSRRWQWDEKNMPGVWDYVTINGIGWKENDRSQKRNDGAMQ